MVVGNNKQNSVNQEMDIFRELIANNDNNILLKVLDSISGYILVIDADSKIVYVNPEYCTTFGVKREKFIGHHLSKLEPLALMHDVLVSGEPMRGTVSHLHSLGIDIIADLVPLYSDGKLIGEVGSFKNVSEYTEVNRELAHFKALTKYLKGEISSKEELPPAFSRILGRSRALIEVLRVAAHAAKSDATMLIRGESGVGKEGLAEAIHYSSGRANGPFIKINCAAIPENLLESELFGYVEGSFTGAKMGGRIGKFELANGGTIFLDEIGDMSLTMQAKLLRVLQEREIERVGSNKVVKLDLRIITATNRNLEEMIKDSLFRQDLFYRLNVISVLVPPLRERKEDIPLLASVFLENMREVYNKQLTFSADAIAYLSEYSWPGNIRELKNVIERITVVCTGPIIQPEDLPINIPDTTKHKEIEKPLKLDKLVENIEKEAITSALRLTGNNKSQAMKMLGLSRRGFYLKLEKYNIKN